MKYFSFLLLTFSITTTLFAQISHPGKQPWPVMDDSPNYFEIREQYLEQLNAMDIESGLLGLDMKSDNLRSKFMRWDYMMMTRVDANGNFPDPYTPFRELDRYKNTHPDAFNAGTRAANWAPVGTAEVPGNGGGVGRMNCLYFDPLDHNILYAGTAGGGLWKSPDAGGTWLPLTDQLPVTSIADIAIDPDNTDIIYVATGDGYAYEASWQADNDFWGGVYSAGILKSTDGGFTWNPTGLSYMQDQLSVVQRIIIHPENTNVLIAATREGIYRTDNGGDTWTLESSAHCYDFAFNTANPDIIYAVGDRDVLKSDNAGVTWTVIQNDLAEYDDRMSIETTVADPDMIYVFAVSVEIFISDNAGVSFTNGASPDGVNDYYGYYDNVLEVSDVNANLLFTGGLDIARSTNGANTWQKKSSWDAWPASNYVHADQKVILCDPLDELIVYAGNDGGIFKSTDKGQTWTDLSEGLRIAQPYRISSSFTDPEIVLSGWQDNGCNLWNGVNWKRVQGGDGMEVIIDYTDSERIYASYQYGYVNRSTDGGDSWTYLPVDGGGWLTPYVMDPINHLVMYYGNGSGGIQKSVNGGTTWSNKPSNLGGEVFAIAVSPADNDYVYACALQTLKVSSNGGDSWTNITAGLPISGIGFNYIGVSDENPQHVWIALSGYDDGNKVYYSENAGSTWTNISGTLPNVPVNTIVYENTSENNRLYIGTDIGVFTKDDLDADWEPYMTGLPNVMIHELEINYASNKLVAATYGRGVWSSDLFEFVTPTIAINVIESEYCPDEDLNISYSATGTFLGGNVFTTQLSDAFGSFASPVNIGSITSIALTGVISCTIPATTDSGSGYRMRVVSSTPAVLGTDNGTDITVTCEIPTALNNITITATTATLEWDAANCADGYTIQYKPVSEPTWITVTTTDPTVVLTGLIPNTLYEWAVSNTCVTSPLVETDFSATEEFTTAQSSLEEILGLSGFSVYPNPFNISTTIQFTLTQEQEIKIELLDITGKIVRQINSEKLPAGFHSFEIVRNELSKGVYTLQFISGDNAAGINLIVD